MKVLVYYDGDYRVPRTVTEAINSEDLSELTEVISKVNIFREVHAHRVLGDEYSNGHFELDEIQNTFNKICEVITHNVNFTPSRCNTVSKTCLGKSDILNMTWDYLVDENGNVLASRRILDSARFLSLGTEVLNLPKRFIKDSIIIMCNGKRSIYNLCESKLITTRIISKTSNSKTLIIDSSIESFNFRGGICRMWSKKFDLENLCSLISNDKKLSGLIKYESSSESKSSLKLYIRETFSGYSPKVNISYSQGIISIRLQMCMCEKEYDLIMRFINTILDSYELLEGQMGQSQLTGLPSLRAVNPKMFVANYTRECQILPVIYKGELGEKSEQQGFFYSGLKLVLEYPRGSNHWYTSPEGFFPGLKKNRLPNAEAYPYIVKCFKRDHMTMSTKPAYRYYNKGLLPVQKTTSFESILSSLGLKKSRVHKEVLLQENYHSNIDCINMSRGDTSYRYFEELYNINIVVVESIKESLYPIIPDCPHPYFWSLNDSRKTIIVIKRVKKHYNKIVEDYSFGSGDAVVSRKASLSVREDSPICDGQFVDFYGKRRLILVDGSWKESVGAPLNVPHMEIINKFIPQNRLPKDEYLQTKRSYYYLEQKL